jgi:hypothetical protein
VIHVERITQEKVNGSMVNVGIRPSRGAVMKLKPDERRRDLFPLHGIATRVYRRRWVIHIERITREKLNGSTANVRIHPSRGVVAKLKLDGAHRFLPLADRPSLTGQVAFNPKSGAL